MSKQDLTRRTVAEVSFDGVDITDSIRPYLRSLTYTDNEEDEADDLQLQLQDREGIWLTQWLNDAVQAAGNTSFGLSIHAILLQENWAGDGKDALLDCGQFELDSIDASGPPATITIKATSLPYSSQVRQTKKYKEWESYTLSGIAKEIASSNGMTCLYESGADPFYERMEQFGISDIVFLSQLCHDAGISLKATNNILVLFDQAAYESKPSVLTIKRGDGTYSKYKLNVGASDTQYASCRVSYTQPATGKLIQAFAYEKDYKEDAKKNQQLEVTAKVSSLGEAKALAEKRLRLHNKYERSASFTLLGNTRFVAGLTVRLQDWGSWDGKYLVKQARHSVSGSGYSTQVQLRRVLEDSR